MQLPLHLFTHHVYVQDTRHNSPLLVCHFAIDLTLFTELSNFAQPSHHYRDCLKMDGGKWNVKNTVYVDRWIVGGQILCNS